MKFLALLTVALATVASAAPNPDPAVVVKTVVVKVGSSGSTSSSSSSTSYGSSSSSSKFSSAFKSATINGHNNARAATGKKLQKLVWSDKRASHACACAKKWSALSGVSDCAIAQNSWKHSKHVSDVDAVKGAISSFVAEKKYYKAGQKFGTGGGVHAYGHYTQMTWSDTREVGCCVSRGSKGTALTCSYYPAGNYRGDTAY